MPVVAKETCRVGGFRDMVHKGRIYDDDADVVLAHPSLFESAEDHRKRVATPKDTNELGERSMSARKRVIEKATAAPGEVRDISYDCPEDGCDYSGTSEHGLKVHRGRNH